MRHTNRQEHQALACGSAHAQASVGVAVDQDFAELILEWLDLVGSKGISVKLTSGYRTLAEQTTIFRRLRTRNLAAPPGRSFHNYGLAFDYVADRPVLQRRAGRLGESLGLRWGGRFRPPDVVHLDAGNYITIEDAKEAGYPGELVEVE